MNINELRVGNHIYIDNKETAVSATDLVTISQNERFLLEKQVINPIFLSEALLFKLGFRVEFEVSPYRVYSLGDFLLISNSNHTFNFFVGQKAVGKPIAYMHQLQNLYLVLAGSELIPFNASSATSTNTSSPDDNTKSIGKSGSIRSLLGF